MHTPGPWKVVGKGNQNGTEHFSVRRVGRDDQYTIARVAFGPDRYMTEDEARANALLIAESPNLLAIAESAVSLWGFLANDPAVSGAERKAAERNRDHVREVLARIRGE